MDAITEVSASGTAPRRVLLHAVHVLIMAGLLACGAWAFAVGAHSKPGHPIRLAAFDIYVNSGRLFFVPLWCGRARNARAFDAEAKDTLLILMRHEYATPSEREGLLAKLASTVLRDEALRTRAIQELSVYDMLIASHPARWPARVLGLDMTTVLDAPTLVVKARVLGLACFGLTVLLLLSRAQPYIRRWRRARRGECTACGYPLLGLPGPRCPECGSVSLNAARTCCGPRAETRVRECAGDD